MIRAILNRQIRQVEKRTGENADFLRHMLKSSPAAVLKFGLLQPAAAHRKAVSIEALYAARLVATMTEDCGPCVQTVINLAVEDGVRPEILRSVMEREWDGLPEPLPLVCRYSEAVTLAKPEATELAEDIAERLGADAQIDLALGITTARMFPSLKRALGYGLSCSKVTFKGV